MNPISQEPVTVLIAEDDDGHAELIRLHLEEAGVTNPMIRFRDGQEVLDFLARHEPEEMPASLLLLDIRMPKVDGVEVLNWIKTSSKWKILPVIMLTTTDDPREVERCYEIGCNCYLNKPVEFKQFSEILTRLGLFLLVIKPPHGTMGEAL